jgi:hypothetical protein
MSHVLSYEKHLLEGARYWGTPTEKTKDVLDAFASTDAGRDLYALGVRDVPEYDKVRFERRAYGQSMPRTGVYKDGGKFHIEHYKGQEVYGEKSFDTIEELFRYLWMRLAKNIIPASLISKREAEKRIDLETMFPIGSKVSQEDFLAKLKPIIGGEELAHPSNKDLVETDTVERLLDLSLIGKIEKYSSGKEIKVVTDISKNAIVKYRFYSTAAETIRNVYADLISEILGSRAFNSCMGTLTSKYSDYETWTVTNTNRIPLNSVNFRTGENTLKCHVQTNEMMSAVFFSIIKRTFRRAKGKNTNQKMIWYGSDPLITELNDLLSDYFFEASSGLEPSVFIERDLQAHPEIVKNAKALLIKYLLKNGSMDLKGKITSNSSLDDLVKFSTSEEDIDDLSRRLIKAAKLLQFI